jgi:hypothetical protein
MTCTCKICGAHFRRSSSKSYTHCRPCDQERRAIKTYFIHSPKLEAVKIGKSINPDARLNHLRTANPDNLRMVKVFQGDYERQLHEILAEHRIIREWFAARPVLEWLDAALADGVLP